jgi:ankyrin repeat protein
VAAANGLVSELTVLVAAGADVDVQANNGVTATMEAVIHAEPSALEILLEAGADPRKRSTGPIQFVPSAAGFGLDAVLLAAWLHRGSMLAPLLGHGASIDTVSDAGVNAVWLAISDSSRWESDEDSSVDFVSLLLNMGASATSVHAKTGKHSLHIAAAEGQTTAGKLLVEHGADISSSDSVGNSVLHHAVLSSRCGNAFMGTMWRECGADPNARNDAGEAPLHIAARRHALTKVETLVQCGAAVDAHDLLGRTPLMVACVGAALEVGDRGHTPDPAMCVVKHLLDVGAVVGARSNRGLCALHFASAAGRADVCLALLLHGAEVSARTFSGRSALHLAGEQGHAAVISLLTSRGARVDARDERGNTALHEAALHGHAVCVSLLLSLGADAAALNGRFRTPVDLAAKREHKAAVRALQAVSKRERSLAAQDLEICGGVDTLVRLCGEADLRHDGWIG